MGGWGVSRVRRVGCGAVLLPVSSVAVSSASVIWYAWAARCRLRHVPSALLPSLSVHLFHGLRSPRRAILPLAYRRRPAFPARLSPSSNSRFRFRRACPPSRWS